MKKNKEIRISEMDVQTISDEDLRSLAGQSDAAYTSIWECCNSNECCNINPE